MNDNQVYEVHPSIAAEAGIPASQSLHVEQPSQVPTSPVQTSPMQAFPMQAFEQEQESVEQYQEPSSPQEEAPVRQNIHQAIEEDRTFRAFQELREARKQAEYERDRLRQQLEAQQRPAIEQPDELEEILSGSDDDLMERKQLKKVVKALQNKFATHQQQTTQATMEAQLKAQYPDFDTIVSAANVERFRQENPELAQTLSTSPDMYNKAVTVYKMIKKMGISGDPEVEAEKQRIQANASKPRAVASISAQRTTSNLQHADAFSKGLTPELKKQLHAEMLAAMKGR